MESPPGFTRAYNYIIDVILKELHGASLSLYLVVYRQTIGWNKVSEEISISQFIKKTNLARSTVTATLKELISDQWILSEHGKRGKLPIKKYSINLNHPKLVRKSNQYENRTSPKIELLSSPKIELVTPDKLVRKSNPQKKGFLKTPQKNTDGGKLRKRAEEELKRYGIRRLSLLDQYHPEYILDIITTFQNDRNPSAGVIVKSIDDHDLYRAWQERKSWEIEGQNE
jgi:phage replication O-like protein O